MWNQTMFNGIARYFHVSIVLFSLPSLARDNIAIIAVSRSYTLWDLHQAYTSMKFYVSRYMSL
jgi:hypothetical protein